MSTIRCDDVGEDLRRIVISGRLDASGAPSISAQLIELAGGAKKAVVVDLSGVEFLTSIGIGALVTSAKAAKSRGGRMTLVVDEGSAVMITVQATLIDRLIPVFGNLADAEKAARQAG